MSSTAITEENAKCSGSEIDLIKDIILERLATAPKLIIDGQEFTLEVNEVVSEFFIQKAKEDLRETPEVIAQGLKEFKELLAGEPDLYVPDHEDFYRIFLRPCKWYARSSFSLMKRYFRFRLNYPHIFTNLLPSVEKEALYNGLIYASPFRSKDGCRIVLIEAGKRWNPKQVTLEQLFKGLILCMEAVLFESATQIAGAHVIIDVDGLSLSQVTYFTPSFAKMVVDFVQRCLPCRLKTINVINQSFIFNMVFAFFKPFLEEKIRKRIFIHGTNRDSLMAIVNKEALFTKYGGELKLPEEPVGPMLWEILCSFEDAFQVFKNFGYKPQKKGKK